MAPVARRARVTAGVRGRVVGGGRITYKRAMAAKAKEAKPSSKCATVSVYGYSKTFGRKEGCNERSAAIVRAAMPAAKVTWSDDGY